MKNFKDNIENLDGTFLAIYKDENGPFTYTVRRTESGTFELLHGDEWLKTDKESLDKAEGFLTLDKV